MITERLLQALLLAYSVLDFLPALLLLYSVRALLTASQHLATTTPFQTLRTMHSRLRVSTTTAVTHQPAATTFSQPLPIRAATRLLPVRAAAATRLVSVRAAAAAATRLVPTRAAATRLLPLKKTPTLSATVVVEEMPTLLAAAAVHLLMLLEVVTVAVGCLGRVQATLSQQHKVLEQETPAKISVEGGTRRMLLHLLFLRQMVDLPATLMAMPASVGLEVKEVTMLLVAAVAVAVVG
mmetsp:Transcript_5257/g.10059  ORF Transcript_5257/g.10059 Transcript_5257/m.10059 type:complete len:238 (+) Transcript_5257:455-1168(+)